MSMQKRHLLSCVGNGGYLHIQCSVLLHSLLEELCLVLQVLQILFVFLNHAYLLLLQVCYHEFLFSQQAFEVVRLLFGLL